MKRPAKEATGSASGLPDLAGHRDGPVYIPLCRHFPPHHHALRDSLPAFLDLLREQSEPAVRLVPGTSCSSASTRTGTATAAWLTH